MEALIPWEGRVCPMRNCLMCLAQDISAIKLSVIVSETDVALLPITM